MPWVQHGANLPRRHSADATMTATVYGVPDVAPLDVEKRRDVVRRVLRGPRVRRAVQDCKRLGDRRLSRCRELAQEHGGVR